MSECLDKCPHCGEILWIEWGFMNPTECMIQEWYNYAYPYRPVSLYSIGDILEVTEVEEIL